jgi:hypothetical protein
MISGLSGTPISLNFGGSANPGDYVFSQTGLDNIITQLMEQANRCVTRQVVHPFSSQKFR